MAGNDGITKEAFLYLAGEAGLDTSSPHMEELYRYVQNVLSGLQTLDGIDVDLAEPETAFIPPRE